MARVNMAKRFHNYCNRVFDLDQWLLQLKDGRKEPRCGMDRIVLGVGMGLTIGLDSMERIAKCIERGNFKAILGDVAFSADTIARGLAHTSIDGLQLILDDILHKARSGKMLANDTIDGFKVVAIDGVTLYSTESGRLGKHSHYRRDAHGERTNKAHYYENAVAIASVGETDALHMVYKLERIPKGKGETTTAIAVLKKLYKDHPSYCDIAVMDAGYAKAAVLNTVNEQKKWFVVRVKQENYNIVKDANGLFGGKEPDYQFRNMQIRDGSKYWYDFDIWEDENFDSWETVDVPLRCLKIREVRKTKNRHGGYSEYPAIETHLVTNAPMAGVKAITIWKIAHLRWDVENNVINTLKNGWNLKHAYSYDPSTAQKVWLIAVLFYNLSQCFKYRNLRRHKDLPARQLRDHIHETLVIWSSQLRSVNPLARPG